jgi:hypothetical protein
MVQKRRIGSLLIASLGATLLAGCASEPGIFPGGATEATVFFTPQVREARAHAGLVYREQSPEYARRDHTVGARPADATSLYTDLPRSRTIVQRDRVRSTSTRGGYSVTQESSIRVRRGPSSPYAHHRRR